MALLAALTLFILLCSYAACSGTKDGILYSLKGANAFPGNEHILFAIERALVITACVVATQIAPVAAAIVVLAFAQAFTFCHNLAYYYTRHATDPAQPFSFDYQSSTSSAKLEIGYRSRMLLLFTGLLTLCLLALV